MNITEIYFLLFTDTLVSNLAINTSSELVIHSMKVFNLYNPYIVVIITTLSFAVASCGNYLLGILCYKVLAPLVDEETKSPTSKIWQLRRSRYLFLLLMLSGIPFFGKFILVLAGFCRINFSRAFIVAISVKLAYYSIYFFV